MSSTNIRNTDISKAGQKYEISFETQTDGGPWTPQLIVLPDAFDSLTPEGQADVLKRTCHLLNLYLGLW